jgi:L-ribulose-5-phosphate 3-epimerase UlaE
MGFEVVGTPAGSGRLDIPRLLQIIKSHGKQPTAILELWTPYTNSVEETIQLEQAWLKQSLDYLILRMNI